MTAVAAGTTGNVSPIRGRKDSTGQEKVIDIGKLRDKVSHLLSLHQSAEEAKAAYGDAIKSISEQAGLQASVVKKYIAARASDNYEDKKRDADQLTLCFEEV